MNKDLLIQRIRTLTHPLEPIPTGHETRLKQIEGIRCVAFDFYGTMFISAVGDIGVDEEQQEKSTEWFEDALLNTGFEIMNPEAGKKGVLLFEQIAKAHIQSARDAGIDCPEPDIILVWMDVLARLQESKDIRGEVSRNTAIRFGVEFEFRINDIWPVPKLRDVLQQLLARNLELGIISNSQFYTPIAFEALLNAAPSDFGFNPELLVWSYKTGRKKPSTDFYRCFTTAAKNENLMPDEILYVGNDIRKDIKPACDLGMRTALYAGDQRSIRHRPEDLEKTEYKPDLIIDDLSQISACLPD